MILDVARAVNFTFGVIVGACFIGGLIAGLVGGSLEPEVIDIDAAD